MEDDDDQIAFYDCKRSCSRVSNGSFSPVDVTVSVLEQVKQHEPKIHAMYLINQEAALAAARASERRWKKGIPLAGHMSTIDGLPVTIKENIATKGDPIPLGTAVSELNPSPDDAPPAARLREAGSVIIGKTTMPDYGMLSSGLSSFHALTRNPWNVDKNPGGSSSGTAAAAAAEYGPLHVGTDIGGSVRLPAAWCGLVGFKPSLGRVPIDPPYMGRVAGPITRTVDEAALLMSVLAQADERDHMSLPPADIDWSRLDRDLVGVRIGVLLDAGCGLPVDPSIHSAVRTAATLFDSVGAIVDEISPWMNDELLRGLDFFWRTRAGVEIAALAESQRRKILPVILEWAQSGLGLTGEAVFANYSKTFEIRSKTVAATASYDYVISPVSPNISFPAEWPSPANRLDEAMAHIGFTAPYSMSEQPAISVNCGYDKSGVPIGLQIAGRRFDDLGVLQIGRAWEHMRGPQRPWPLSMRDHGQDIQSRRPPTNDPNKIPAVSRDQESALR